MDANVVRVLARLRRLAGDPKLAVKEHAALADALLDPDRPGDFNQVITHAVCCFGKNPHEVYPAGQSPDEHARTHPLSVWTVSACFR